MKTPSLTAPSSPQCTSYEQLTFDIAQHTIEQYASFLSSESIVDQAKWKHLKSHGAADIYRAREDPTDTTDTTESTTSGLQASSTWQPLASLLCVGRIRGTLDDAMYGIVSPTATSMAIRSLYIGDNFVSHRVLEDLELPTAEELFRYLGLKWIVRSPSLGAIIRPRDMVFVEASGVNVMLTPDGHARVGYVVYDSVDAVDVDLTTADRPVRAHMRGCYLFRQVAPNAVEMYATMLTNPGGSIPAKLAALSGASIMTSVLKVVDCALKKKLAWMRSTRQATPAQSDYPKKHRQRQCPVCSRGLSHLSSVVKCRICYTLACSRCITNRSLVMEKRNGKLGMVSMPMCRSCITTAMRTDNGAEVMAREYVCGSGTAFQARSSLSSWDSVSFVEQNPSFDGNMPPPLCQSHAPTEEPMVCDQSLVEEFDEEVVEEISTVSCQSVKVHDHVDLLMQMNALRLQAEHTFLVVSQQSQSICQREATCQFRG